MSIICEPKYKVTIKDWANDDKPREKLVAKGRSALSDAELIAILISSGNKTQSAVELSKSILSTVKNNLGDLGRLEVRDLLKFKGIGNAKAIAIIAALELGRRRKAELPKERTAIKSSNDAYVLLHPHLCDLPHEEFWILLLNRANVLIDKIMISRGGLTGTVADIRLIFKYALEKLASGIILSHNHPSGNAKPSNEDILLTKRLQDAAKLLEINLLDHLIVTNSTYYSLADNSKM